ncbi:MAG: hypothetical protein E4G95_02185 [Bacteroidia bacterium]|nr:MAG: hypothetical protein E4G95_02185 [Bacteroidia bacterium]
MFNKLIIAVLIFCACKGVQKDVHMMVQPGDNSLNITVKGEYLGQEKPGLTPVIFAPGIVSTDRNEVNSVFNPEGDEFYFSMFVPGKGYRIMQMKETGNGWTEPELISFSGIYSEVDVFLEPSGNKLFFSSKRPASRGDTPSAGYQIWMSERDGTGWGEPVNTGPNINIGNRQLYPTLTKEGTLYFNSDCKGYGKGDFYKSEYNGKEYSKAINLGNSINTEYDETDVFIAPDESYLIFTSVGRPDGFGSGDLYISFKIEDGSWSKAVNMGENINTESSEFCPVISPDGKYFFFTSERRGNNDIYWVDADIIEEFKPHN